MTPVARIQAAIDVLDRVIAGAAAEQALTQWARASRFAGSGDRMAVRDHVFDMLRCRRSFAARGGGGSASGRLCMTGALVATGVDPATVFTGDGYAPAPLTVAERAALHAAAEAGAPQGLDALDCPDWLEAAFRDSLGAQFAPVMQSLRRRAPVILRVNAARCDRAEAQAVLAGEGIGTRLHSLAGTALEVTENGRRIAQSRAYLSGLVELQDAAPQAAVEALPLGPGMRVLDFCAGGGGKVLAMAARVPGHYVAHDAEPARMRDLPRRAARAGNAVEIVETGGLSRLGAFDLVLADVPCSGSGTWRRAPDAKWRLTPDRLEALRRSQLEILDEAAGHVSSTGYLAYMTCSLLVAENSDRIGAFLGARPDWRMLSERLFTPLEGGDGFYSALLGRTKS